VAACEVNDLQCWSAHRTSGTGRRPGCCQATVELRREIFDHIGNWPRFARPPQFVRFLLQPRSGETLWPWAQAHGTPETDHP
jgi:hypothetical protein